MSQKPVKKTKQLETLSLDWRKHIGFQQELNYIAELVKQDRLPQVILFVGREGIGKKAFVNAVSSIFYCQSLSACGQCEGCRWILSGEHPEILALDGQRSLKVEDAIRLQEHLSIKASRCQWTAKARRIGLIFDADQLTLQATNRLLKTIEEPPAFSSIFLSTSRAKLLLPTLLSRCVRWQLKPPPLAETVAYLQKRMQQEEHWLNLNEEETTKLVERHSLSPGKVIQSLSQNDSQSLKKAEELARLLNSRRLSDMLKEAEELCRQRDWTALDLAREAEYTLNLWYKGMLERRCEDLRFSPLMIKKRRELLSQLKRIAGKQRIALNAQLAAEHLGICSSTIF